MDKIKRLDPFTTVLPAPEFNQTRSDSRVYIADKRMARLLVLLHQLDQSVSGLEELPQTELCELVSSAILACGFVDGTEARHAISAVLKAIEMRDPMPEES